MSSHHLQATPTAPEAPSGALRNRRGFALAAAIFAIVVVGALIAGAYFTSGQENRMGRNMLVDQRSFSLAEYGLNYEIANWNTSRNLLGTTCPPVGTSGPMAVGCIDSTRRYIRDRDTALVRVTRTSPTTFWVVAEGSANIGIAQAQSMRRTSQFVRIAYPSISVKGAVMSAGNVSISGSSAVTGNDSPPSGWDCSNYSGTNNTGGIAIGPTTTFTGDSTGGTATKGVTGSPALVRDPSVTDSNTYVRYGSETWNTLAANADIKLTDYNPKAVPVGTDTTCNRTTQYNWGEPFHTGSGTVIGCRSYYPIIYSDTSLKVAGGSRGQGILMVNGDLELAGNFDWDGLIIVKDDIALGAGTVNVSGALLVRNANLEPCKKNGVLLTDCSLTAFNGNFSMKYSQCAIENALRASAILVPVKKRSWAQLF